LNGQRGTLEIDSATIALAELQQRTHAERPNWLPDDEQVITYSRRGNGLIDVRIYVSPDDALFEELQTVVAAADIAPHLHALVFEGPDEGANGTREWNFRPLIATDAYFPALRKLFIEPSSPGDHNGSIIGWIYKEENQTASLVRRMPQLRDLTVPSTPEDEFFQVPLLELRQLRVDFGFDRQDFLANFSHSIGFPALRVVELGFTHIHSADNPDVIAPFEEYQELFLAPSFAAVEEVVLRNPGLSDDEVRLLLAERRDLQLTITRTHAAYRR